MADNGLVKDGLGSADAAASEQAKAGERRAFLRRAALAGLPVVLATVQAQTVWATTTKGSNGACAKSRLTSSSAFKNCIPK